MWLPLIDNSSTLSTVPSLQVLEWNLLWAAKEGRTEEVIAMLDKGVNIEARQVMGS